MSFISVDYQREAFVFRIPDGLPVYTHYSFLFTTLIITAPLWFQGRLSSVVIALALAGILFLSILAHELGHVAAARAQHARAGSIEIGLFGGLANLEWDFRAIAIRQVALAGPVVNLGLAGTFFAAYWLVTQYGAAEAPRSLAPLEAPAILSRTLLLASILNLGLALLNLLPAYPLDGGTIAQDLLGARLGDRRATLIVGICGLVLTCFGTLVGLAMLLLGTPIFAPFSFRQNWRAIVENWRGGPASAAKDTGLRKILQGGYLPAALKKPGGIPVIHVVAIITAKPGQRAAILSNFAANRPAVLAEAGCIEYGAAVDVETMGTAAYGPDAFVVIEKWESEDTLKAHAAAPHMKAYGEKNKDLIASRVIHVLKPV